MVKIVVKVLHYLNPQKYQLGLFISNRFSSFWTHQRNYAVTEANMTSGHGIEYTARGRRLSP